jgi:hypothetical protein
MLMRVRPAATSSSAVEADAVRRHRDGCPTRHRRTARDDLGEVGPHERFTARESDVVHPEVANRNLDEAGDLGRGEQVIPRDRGEPFFGHAVRAAQRALLGDRDAQVARDAAEPVDEASDIRASDDGRQLVWRATKGREP